MDVASSQTQKTAGIPSRDLPVTNEPKDSLRSEGLVRAPLVVIGAAGDVGRAIYALGARHCLMAGIDRRPAPPEWCGPYLQMNLIDSDTSSRAMETISGLPQPIKGVVLTMGSYRRFSLGDYDDGSLRRVFEDNFFGSFHLVQKLVPFLEAQGGGNIVMVTSGASATGGRDPGYAAAKAALGALMKSVAREYGAKGISCNAVSPGPLEGAMSQAMGPDRKEYYRQLSPNRRLSTPSEVAEVVLFLAGLNTTSVNGATLDVDGGLLRR